MLKLVRQQLYLRFIAATIPAVLVLVVLLSWAFYKLTTDIVGQLSERFVGLQVSYDRMRTMEPLLQEIGLARKLAHSPDIINWAEYETNPEYASLGIRKLEEFRSLFRDGSYFFVVDRSGHYYFNDFTNTYAGKQLRYTLSPSKNDDAWYYATVKNPQECQINVNNDIELKVTKVWINCLVRKDGHLLGVIGTGIDLTTFVDKVLRPDLPGVLTMFVDGSGAIQAHPDIRNIDFHSLTKTGDIKKTVYRLLDDTESQDRLQELFSRVKADPSKIQTISLSIGGSKKLLGVAYIKEIDWFNITMITPSIWALGEGFLPLAILALLGVFAAFGFGAFVLHRLVLTRIGMLDKAINKVRESDFAIDLHDSSSDEIGRLTRSLVEMSNAVRQNQQTLESEVAERTNELTSANYRLMRELEIVDKNVIVSSSNLKGVITSVSDAFCRISGYSREELIGMPHNIIRHPDMPRELFKEMWDTIKSGKIWHGEIKNRTKDGGVYWVEANIEPDYTPEGEKKGYISIRHDITDKKRIEELSVSDRLTRLFNRHKLDECFSFELKRAERYDRPLSIILLDIDFFKSVNDTYGHQVGDDVLVTLADIIRKNIRQTDVAGRWGGEEFLILCPETDLSGVVKIADKLRVSIETHVFQIVGQKTASFGVTTAARGEREEKILARADQALYKAKQSGRNRVEEG